MDKPLLMRRALQSLVRATNGYESAVDFFERTAMYDAEQVVAARQRVAEWREAERLARESLGL